MSDEASAAPVGDSAPALDTIAPAATSQESISASDAARILATSRRPKAESAEPATADPELAPEADAAPVTDPGETDDQGAEPESLPPIEPPRSWTKAERERFNSLPRETQEYLHSREAERERDFRRSQNEVAESRKAAQAEREQAEQVRKQYESQLPSLMQELQKSQQSSFADVRTVDDVEKMAAEDPFRYLQWQAHQTKLQAVNAELTKAQEEQSRSQRSQWAEHVQKENELAAEYIPELADKTKASELTSRAAERLSELGFKPDELAKLASGDEKLSIYDHRIQRLIFSDLKLSDIQKAKAVAVAKPVPTVQRPGVAPARSAASDATIQALKSRLEQTGRPEDAMKLLVAQRAATRR